MELEERLVFVSLRHSRNKHCICRYSQNTVILSSQSRIFSFSDSTITGQSTQFTVYRYYWKFLSYLLSYRDSSHCCQCLTFSRRFVSIILATWDQNACIIHDQKWFGVRLNGY